MTINPYPTDYVTTDRGGIIENRHQIHAAIVSASTGKTLFAVGNPSRTTLARSAAKPAQALAILRTGAFDTYFEPADLALICASHSSEPRHVARAARMLSTLDLPESALRCGGHAPLSDAVNRAWIKADFEPGPLCNNCSGKHVGMLAGTRALGANEAEYHLPGSPMQVAVKRAFEDVCALREGEGQVSWATDGCNLPAPACPLHALARSYARFAGAADAVAAGEAALDAQTRDMARIFNAMARHSELVGGEGRFCTELATAFEGAVVGKLGADACYGVGIRESEATRRLGADGAIGIAVKVEDGSIEILYAAVAEILEQLGIGTPEVRAKFDKFHRLVKVNTAGVVTGRVECGFRVRAV
ncbi:uncharacterized protein K452DRAFT_273769 [Aplosporella prunicola CBS 121167]|uniref:Asparaginase n=1 Tax=Aplosporella prunicola CBS 121167 TaxID=1176127 RepID=A0A6A6B7R4_9PEZI|nr:uncharacterized protein K452DRAFT_273769 [Aplosporella prunicola CBS 121167]KAF2140179.1 hypothetical protein K452DRAFT_273769 [Aplosporella prunicola CBS 121167]